MPSLPASRLVTLDKETPLTGQFHYHYSISMLIGLAGGGGRASIDDALGNVRVQ